MAKARKKLKVCLSNFINNGPHPLKANKIYATYDELIDFLISPEVRPLLIQTIIEKERKNLPCVELAGGIDVPTYMVESLREFITSWPGSMFEKAIPGIAVTALHQFMKGPKQ